MEELIDFNPDVGFVTVTKLQVLQSVLTWAFTRNLRLGLSS